MAFKQATTELVLKKLQANLLMKYKDFYWINKLLGLIVVCKWWSKGLSKWFTEGLPESPSFPRKPHQSQHSHPSGPSRATVEPVQSVTQLHCTVYSLYSDKPGSGSQPAADCCTRSPLRAMVQDGTAQRIKRHWPPDIHELVLYTKCDETKCFAMRQR